MPSPSVTSSLEAAARETPERLALITPRGSLTFRELDRLSTECAAGLVEIGMHPGDRVALMVRPGIEMVAAAFGLLKAGGVPVLIDPGIGRRFLAQCLSEAAPVGFIGVPLADWARLLLGWARHTLCWKVTTGRPGTPGSIPFAKVLSRGRKREFQANEPQPDDTAAIVFTSGSTGPPKGVVYTHRMFHAQAELLRQGFSIEQGEVDLATFPLFALYDPAWRATTVLPRMDFTQPGKVDPAAILDPIRERGVTHMFGSPALLDQVGRYAEKTGVKLPGLRRVLSAGAPVSDSVLSRFASLLAAEAAVHTPYGATEALPVTSIDHRERLELGGPSEGRGTCIGRPLPGVRLELLVIDDGPITQWSPSVAVAEGQVGELAVWGDNVSVHYWRRPEADRLAKIRDEHGRIGHRMGDLGYRDEAGRIWFCGRKSQRVQTVGGTLFTVQCEGIFNAHPGVRRTALVGIGPVPRQIPILCVEVDQGAPELEQIRRGLLELAEARPETRRIRRILFHPGFPVDIRHNAKIYREQLAIWAAERG